MYTSYELTAKSKKFLLKKFPPKHKKVIGHHVTYEFGITKEAHIPDPTNLKVIGYKNNTKGIEALVVSVNGTTKRPDNKTFHITWSLDPEIFKPNDSNTLLEHENYTLILPITLYTTPAFSV